MKKSEPCKGCKKETGRHAGCHATCPKYKAAAEQNKERREAERKNRIIYGYIKDEVFKSKMRSRKYRKR